MKEQHYKQVWIESEDDLPKVNGEYFAHARSRDRIITMHWWDSEGQYGIDVWMRTVDWYLAEVEHPKGLTDEEIEKEFPTDIDILRNTIENLGNVYTRSTINKLKREGAKWAKDKLTNK